MPGRVCDRTQYDTMRQARYGTVGEGAIGSAAVTVLSFSFSCSRQTLTQ